MLTQPPANPPSLRDLMPSPQVWKSQSRCWGATCTQTHDRTTRHPLWGCSQPVSGGGERGPRAEHAFRVRGRTCVGILQLFRGTLTHYVFESSSFRLQNGVKTPVSSKHSLTTDLLSSGHSTTLNENTQNLTSTPSPHSRMQWT